MRITDFIRTAGRALAFLAFITSTASAQIAVQATMSSRFLARGETASLDIAILNGMPRLERSPAVPQVPDVKIEAGQPEPRMISARRSGYVFPFLISSYKEGRHIIPAITLQLDGKTYTTPPQEFTVFNPDELKWSEASVGDQKMRYSASFHPLKDNPYEGETVPVEIKLYIPRDIPVEDWGIPEFERDGIACWRFEPSGSWGQTNILGRSYISVAYPSSMSATRSGTVSIGPANLRLMLRTIVNDPFPRMSPTPVFLAIPKFDLQAKKLPEGAPAGFVNAVGSFTMSSKTTQTELREGDPLSVDVTVTGTGNLDGMTAPKPKDADGWKIYEASAEQRGDERRQETGSVTFHQFMRPLGDKASVPGFQLVYFDPQLAQYKTIETPPIPLKLLPSLKEKPLASAPLAPPQAAGIPVEKMNDILGLVQPARIVLPGATRFPSWTWQLVPGLVALLLIIKAIWMKAGPKFRIEPEVAARRQAFRELERVSTADHPSFLRQAGRFIEQWLPKAATQDSSLHAILEERDATCYRGEGSPDAKGDRSRRSSILKVIRKFAWLWIAVAWFGFSSDSKAAGDEQLQTEAVAAYDSAEYEKAIQMWLDAGPFDRLSADTLYNIGNACYRMGVPGHAALYYRRALEKDSSHAEALQNLRFIERKYGSVSVKWDDYQYALTRLQLQTWRNTLWAGVWMVVLGVLVCLATRAGSKARIPAVIGLVLGPMIAAAGALGSHYYPDDSRFAPLTRQAVVVNEDSALHSEASRTSQEIIDARVGSLCEIIKDRGAWLYVSFATKTRGWIPAEDVEKVVPDKKPEAPKLHKPDADSRST
ncbi:BatD family protein [Luteolibacter ambystomatis]|uniref:BatD family protein n=1 Tax=Luteolibacter ambystomatis TaxID=2824561 RepID=A0A975PEX0_9BACT|nr:tetratricopeptide repeat protein [Luteolibacter ambystomatis]QUE51698.1 BatD family protein [Luteolibacter ambystomatis]